MATQTYATHRHPPTLTFIGLFFFIASSAGFALLAFGIGGRREMWELGLGGLLACTFVLLTISRFYTTALQDRIIKLEMRVRCASLLTPPQQAILARLAKPQLVALRFASDAELPALVEQADHERLSANQIKRAIKNWVPDLDRT